MKKDSGKRVKLGFFVTAALLVVLAAIYFIGQKQSLFGATFRISGTFTEVSGLQAGNNVRFAGVNVGSVEAVTITSKNAVRVDMVVREEIRQFLKKDAVASIGAESMMGNKVVMLAPGSDGESIIANHDVIRTVVPIGFDDVLISLKHTGDNATVITDNLAHLSSKIISGKGTLGKIVMDDEFARDLGTTLVNLKEGSAGLKDTMAAVQQSWLLWGFGKRKADKKEADKKEEEKKSEVKAVEKIESKDPQTLK